MKNNFTKSILICLMMTSFFACQKDTQPTLTSEAGKKVAVLEAPSLSSVKSGEATITLLVTAGKSGAPAGFSVQWMKAADFTGVWPTDSASTPASFCKASFSGVPGASFYNLAANDTVSVTIGAYLYDNIGASSSCEAQDLTCSTAYVFRTFAHTDPAKGGKAKSDWSPTITASTAACPDTDCGHHFGYWKNNAWPASVVENGLMLGTVSYSNDQLQTIFNTKAKAGNGLINLAHMLIVDKLNYANGLRGTAYEATMAEADALIGGTNVLTGTMTQQQITSGINGKLNVLSGATCGGN